MLFVQTTPNPAMQDDPALEEATRLMERECATLISEIERLEMFRAMQAMRLENVMNLVRKHSSWCRALIKCMIVGVTIRHLLL